VNVVRVSERDRAVRQSRPIHRPVGSVVWVDRAQRHLGVPDRRERECGLSIDVKASGRATGARHRKDLSWRPRYDFRLKPAMLRAMSGVQLPRSAGRHRAELGNLLVLQPRIADRAAQRRLASDGHPGPHSSIPTIRRHGRQRRRALRSSRAMSAVSYHSPIAARFRLSSCAFDLRRRCGSRRTLGCRPDRGKRDWRD
jgi:hypothetical protein